MIDWTPETRAAILKVLKQAKSQWERRVEFDGCECDHTSVHPCEHRISYSNACAFTEEAAEELFLLERTTKHSRDGEKEA